MAAAALPAVAQATAASAAATAAAAASTTAVAAPAAAAEPHTPGKNKCCAIYAPLAGISAIYAPLARPSENLCFHRQSSGVYASHQIPEDPDPGTAFKTL